MSSFVAAKQVWKTIDSLASLGPKKAAVSYVSSDVVVKFSQGDVLVVDGSDEAVRAGQTNALVLWRAVMRGAHVVSVPQLHAKVMLFGKTALIGSANLSLHSAAHLIEAALLVTEKNLIGKISKWIAGLARTGNTVDDALLSHMLSIMPRLHRTIQAFRTLVEPQIIFFKQVLPGDIRKYNMQSSTAGTGGGARDLRVSRASLFRPLLRTMLSERSQTEDVTYGCVRSYSRKGRPIETSVELWPPTSARPNELRISRFYEVPGWAVDGNELQKTEDAGQMLFYVLEMDIHGTVTAKVMNDEQLGKADQTIAAHIKELSRGSPRKAIVGAIDLLHKVTVP